MRQNIHLIREQKKNKKNFKDDMNIIVLRIYEKYIINIKVRKLIVLFKTIKIYDKVHYT